MMILHPTVNEVHLRLKCALDGAVLKRKTKIVTNPKETGVAFAAWYGTCTVRPHGAARDTCTVTARGCAVQPRRYFEQCIDSGALVLPIIIFTCTRGCN